MVLRGDLATVLNGVKADDNGDNGVLVSGAETSKRADHRHQHHRQPLLRGVGRRARTTWTINNLTLTGDQAGGLELNRVTEGTVHNITTADEPNGVFLHVNSLNVVLDSVTVTGGRTGIVVEKTTKGLHVTDSTIDTAHVAGMAIGGHDTLLDGLTVKGSRTGVRVERGAGGVTANKLTLVGGDDGLVTSGGTIGVVVKDLSTDGVGQRRRPQPEPRHADHRRADPRRQHRHGPAGGHHSSPVSRSA